jgi:hypothetical protein
MYGLIFLLTPSPNTVSWAKTVSWHGSHLDHDYWSTHFWIGSWSVQIVSHQSAGIPLTRQSLTEMGRTGRKSYATRH